MKWRELQKDEFLYQKGDEAIYFYFMLKGKVEVMSESGGTLKFSKNIDENEFFGK
jgi:CRP-like cAMP-binding protein